MRTDLNKIKDSYPELKLYDIRKLYRDNVCNRISEFALGLLKPYEMKRCIAISLYINNAKAKNRTRIINKISILLGVSYSSVEKWCPSPKKKRIGNHPNPKSINQNQIG